MIRTSERDREERESREREREGKREREREGKRERERERRRKGKRERTSVKKEGEREDVRWSSPFSPYYPLGCSLSQLLFIQPFHFANLLRSSKRILIILSHPSYG